MKLFAVIPVVLAVFLGACASTAQPPLGEGRPGTLVVYQPLSSNSDARLPFIYVDGYNLGRMGIGDAKTVALTPGDHRVSLREPLLLWPGVESAVTEVSISAGKTSYIRFLRKQVSVNAVGNAVTLPSLNEVTADLGEAHQ